MTDFAQSNLILIIVALLIGVVIAWWAFSRRSASRIDDRRDPEATVAPAAAPLTPSVEREVAVPPPGAAAPAEDAHEGRGLADQGAAATADVTGQMLGVPVHSELPGAEGPPDNLQLLKGVGPKLATQLNDNGVTRFEQLARLSPNEVAMLEDNLGAFKGRLTRDRVTEQAAYLARGDTDGFEALFGKLGG